MKRQITLLSLATIALMGTFSIKTEAAPKVRRTVRIKILEAKVGRHNGNFDPGSLRPGSLAITPLAAPDFYVVPKIDGKQLKRTKIRINRTHPRFNHTVTRLVSPRKKLIPISLKLMDSDRWPNKDDTADINPSSNARILTLNYEPLTGKVYRTTGTALGHSGQTITVRGDHRKYQASINFIVNHSDRRVSDPKPKPPFDPNCRIKRPNCQPK
ncbi:hypothetical protein IQ266_04515 [filamentous cyanobacterium LEGE 11480]|uniref:C2 domain-containing protein n=1 Tax=Romeriopsis navalis LEGE 11480 TaxID=2777977 RepID=A0A928VN47_9CYAN|nr:C2 domain-containing protein [Romeriopsis navalis]MBE9029024.1 hypothetical protein [Romeriopsis navalis LEGE 11480]